jgi:hypothetical protein
MKKESVNGHFVATRKCGFTKTALAMYFNIGSGFMFPSRTIAAVMSKVPAVKPASKIVLSGEFISVNGERVISQHLAG